MEYYFDIIYFYGNKQFYYTKLRDEQVMRRW